MPRVRVWVGRGTKLRAATSLGLPKERPGCKKTSLGASSSGPMA